MMDKKRRNWQRIWLRFTLAFGIGFASVYVIGLLTITNNDNVQDIITNNTPVIRDGDRQADATALNHAIKINQVDFQGQYLAAVDVLEEGKNYMIGHSISVCNSKNDICAVKVEAANDCVNLDGLVFGGYLNELPIAPEGEFEWNDDLTGYVLSKEGNQISITACESETDEVITTRR